MGRDIPTTPGTFDTRTTGDMFATFGEFLRYLRRRERLTQTDLGISVGYSTQHINLLESGRRLPDPITVAALFVPALHLENRSALATRLVELASAARTQAQMQRPASAPGRSSHDVALQREITRIETAEEVGTLEDPPSAPPLAVDRPSDLERLRTRLAAERYLALCGLPGMGKTTLASRLARDQAQRGPVFWLTFTEGVNASVDAVVRQLALFAIAYNLASSERMSPIIGRASAAPPLSLDQQIVLLSSVFNGRGFASCLLCFDNAHVLAGDPALVRLFERLFATTPAAVLLVSREDVPLPGLAHMQLDGLGREEATDLVHKLVDPAGSAREPAPEWIEPQLIERLYGQTAGSPMLLRLGIGQLLDSHLDISQFVEQLASGSQIDTYLLDTIFSRLSLAARNVASLVAVIRRPVNLHDPALVDLMRKHHMFGTQGAGSLLAELQRRHVLDNSVRAALPPLLASHLALALASNPEEWRDMHLLAAQYSEQYLGDIVEAAYHYCKAAKLNEMAGVLADQGSALFSRGSGQAALEVVDDGLAQARRKRSLPVGLLRRLLTTRGDLLSSSQRADEAEANFREALALAVQEGSPPTVRAQIIIRLASCLTQRSQVPEALDLCKQALEMLTPGDNLLVSQLMMVESAALAILGRFDDAEARARTALDLSEALITTLPGVVLGIRARAFNTLGMVSAIRQQHDEALHFWSNAIDAARQSDFAVLEYRCRGNMGNVFLEKGDLERATQYCGEAVSALRAIGDDYGAVRFMTTLANAQYLRGNLDAALETLEGAMDIKRRMGDHPGLALSLATEGMVLLAQGHTTSARSYIDDALRELEDTSATRVKGFALLMLSDAQIAAGDPTAALSTLQRAVELPGLATDIKWSADLQNHRALALLALGDLSLARKITTEPLASDTGIEVDLMRSLIDAAISLAEGNSRSARAAFAAAETRAHNSGLFLYRIVAARLLQATHHSHSPLHLAKIFYSTH